MFKTISRWFIRRADSPKCSNCSYQIKIRNAQYCKINIFEDSEKHWPTVDDGYCNRWEARTLKGGE